jgi:formylglycine-generating enzyme required for sulfatase activity
MPDDSNDNLDDLDRGETRPPDAGDTLDSAPTIRGETILAGRYRIVRELGRGAMGTVYLAADRKLDDRPVAIKMPAAVLARNPRAVQALKEEALRAMEVVHSGVVTLRSFEETPDGVFLVMDYIDGRTLEDVLAERKTLPEDEILRLLRPIADAIDYAHTRRVIHRDMKPSNILIDKDGLPHVADFGIAREMKDTYTRTTGKTTSGTLPYMSPEQLCGRDPAPAQDIYSLAATMYECLVGHPPFYRGEIPHQIMTLAPARPERGGAIVDAVMAGLSKSPAARPPSCCAMIACASGTPHPAFGHPLPHGERGKTTLSLDGRGEGVRVTPSPAKRSRRLWLLLAALFAILAAIGIYAWVESRNAPEKVPEPPSSPPKAAAITPTPQPKPVETPVAPPKKPIEEPRPPEMPPEPTPAPEPAKKPVEPSKKVIEPRKSVEIPPEPPKPAPPSGPQFRVRIARLPVSQPNIIDSMREFLSQNGIETELETHSGYYILYGQERFPDKKKADDTAMQVNKQLAAFEKKTRVPMGANAYSMLLGTKDPGPEEPSATPSGQQDTSKELTLDLGGGVTMKCVLIPAGKFMMGSPASEANRDADETQHQVTITKPFYMGATEVTVGQFAAFVKEAAYQTDADKEGWAYAWTGTQFDKVNGASWRKPGFPQDDTHPVTEVSWNDAAAFCQWLSRKSGRTVRLPTEAEWEYACRAGTTTAYQWGDDPDMGKGWCNAADQTAKARFPNWVAFNWSDGYVFTSPAGSFRANAWGLYDMHGNVWEWCADWYGEYPAGAATDPKGAASGTSRVFRGGAWDFSLGCYRPASRASFTPESRNYDFGFRVVVSVSAPGL